jgi:hypothetical protein
MDATLTARVVAAGRIGFGAALIAAPERVTVRWLGRDSSRAAVHVVTRGLGARDVALGIGVLISPQPQLAPWVAAAIVADTADLVATVAAGRSLPLTGRVMVGALACGGAVLGALSLAGLRSPAAVA